LGQEKVSNRAIGETGRKLLQIQRKKNEEVKTNGKYIKTYQ